MTESQGRGGQSQGRGEAPSENVQFAQVLIQLADRHGPDVLFYVLILVAMMVAVRSLADQEFALLASLAFLLIVLALFVIHRTTVWRHRIELEDRAIDRIHAENRDFKALAREAILGSKAQNRASPEDVTTHDGGSSVIVRPRDEGSASGPEEGGGL